MLENQVQSPSGAANLKQAEALVQNCQLRLAEPILQACTADALAKQDYDTLLRAQNMQMRIYAEQERFAEIPALVTSLESLFRTTQIPLSSRAYYTRALCAAYQNQLQSSLEFAEKSLDLAMVSNSKEDLLYALSGLGACAMTSKEYPRALGFVEKIKVILEMVPDSEILFANTMNEATLYGHLGDHQRGLDILSARYEWVRSQKSLLQHIQMLVNYAWLYEEQGKQDLAIAYYNFADRLCDPSELQYRSRFIKKQLLAMNQNQDKNPPDLRLNFGARTLVEKNRGTIDFKNQFILLDLLRFLIEQQGRTISKEEIVRTIWQQEYNPHVHDNKIYVTIKRLRKLIEPDDERPIYLFRAQDGYYLSKQVRIEME